MCPLINEMEQNFIEDAEGVELTTTEILALLDSPREDLSSHVHDLITNELSIVTTRWLINGLLDYFFQLKSKRLLNVILDAPEHHWKFLMDRILEGLKSNDKFKYTSLLLYAVSANPPFPWVKKLSDHQIIKEIFIIVNPSHEKDVSVVVSGLMFLVVLLPTIPYDMSVHLAKMLELFWVLMQHTPTDNALHVYLQLAVFFFFQRLYALYPCRFIGFLRYHSESKTLYENTLFPMLEKVRLHPLLLTETKDTEIRKNRWRGKARHELIQECAQLSLDPFVDIPEGLDYATYFRGKSDSTSSNLSLGEYLGIKKEGRIWSPGVIMSPSKSSCSTPVYTSQFSRTMSRSSIPESPLETAEEAISQTTTPCESLYVRNSLSPISDERKSLTATSKCLQSPKENSSQDVAGAIDTTEMKKDFAEFKDEDNRGENFFSRFAANTSNEPDGARSQVSQSNYESDVERRRKRKPSVYNKDFGQRDSKSVLVDTIEEEITTSNESNKRHSYDSVVSEDSGDEGIGAPTQDSWSELMKTVNTRRLRFLSQCGPPPNLSRDSRSDPQPVSGIRRSRSFPNICDKGCGQGSGHSHSTRKEFAPSLSHSKIEIKEACTQTEEAEVLDPYEVLLEALKLAPTNQNNKLFLESSFEELTRLMRCIPTAISVNDLEWATLGEGTDNTLTQQIRCLYSMLKVEKFKKDMYAERNKRLFSKIKHYYYLFDKQKSTEIELKSLSDEVSFLRNHHITLKTKISAQKTQISNMTSLESLESVRSALHAATIEKEYLMELSKKLASDKHTLQDQLRCSESRLADANRKMTICAQHSERNEALKIQLQSHQKQILLMGEIHREVTTQLASHRNSEDLIPVAKYEEIQNRMEEQRLQFEYENREKDVRLKIALLRVAELQSKLEKKEQQITNDQQDMRKLRRQIKDISAPTSPSGVSNGIKGERRVRQSNDTTQREASVYPEVKLGPYLQNKVFINKGHCLDFDPQ